jgi:DNA-binding response OmpR family regulator
MQAKVLIVEDVVEMADLIALFLSKEGMQTVAFENAEAALERLKAESFDIIVLDVNLPGMDGFEFLTEARKITACPVLVVSARSADEDLITGLGHGADEYMTKPFSPKVLVARVRALLRRSRGAEKSLADAFTFGPFTLDRSSCVLRKGDEILPLSVKEFSVLSYLIANGGKAQTPQAIYDAVWKNKYGDLTAVAVYIQRLRKKLEVNPSEPEYIVTDYGRGYRFNEHGGDCARRDASEGSGGETP